LPAGLTKIKKDFVRAFGIYTLGLIREIKMFITHKKGEIAQLKVEMIALEKDFYCLSSNCRI